MSTQTVHDRPGTLPTRLVKTAGLFLALSMVAFAALNILANILQHTFVMIVEGLIVGVPFLVAVGCAVGAVIATIVKHNRPTPV